MEKLKRKLKISACIGFKTHKEDCNISNFSEFQTADSGIVSDQSSLQDHPRLKSLSEKQMKSSFIEFSTFHTNTKPRMLPSNQAICINQQRIPYSHNLSAINENSVIGSYPPVSNDILLQSQIIDYGPIHPYMKVPTFHKEQTSDTYTAVASTSEDDSQSNMSELFIPVKRSGKKSKEQIKIISKYVESNIETSDGINWERMLSKILLKIFKYLSIGDILNCSQTCRNWYFVAWQPTLWSSIDFSRWIPENKFIDINFKIKKLLSLIGGRQNPCCPIVHSIKLDKCSDLKDDSLIYISNCCPNLRNLSIRKCTLISNISIFHILSKCNEMRKLNVEGCKMISAINTLPESDVVKYNEFVLSDLNLSSCNLVDDASLIILASKFKNMERLLLRNCGRISDSGINYIVRYCHNLRELSLNHLQKISDASICNISEKLNENLRYLSLANCTQVTDAGLISLADNCSNLQYLNLHKCKLITDSGIISLAISLQTRLVSLNLSYCIQITNKSISVLSRYCSNLQQLDLNQCINISDESIEEICRHISNLKMINIDNTSATIRSYDVITGVYPRCSIHHNFITDC